MDDLNGLLQTTPYVSFLIKNTDFYLVTRSERSIHTLIIKLVYDFSVFFYIDWVRSLNKKRLLRLSLYIVPTLELHNSHIVDIFDYSRFFHSVLLSFIISIFLLLSN